MAASSCLFHYGLPAELAHFRPLPECSFAESEKMRKAWSAMERAKHSSFPWDQIERMWLIHTDLYGTRYRFEFVSVELTYGEYPAVHIGRLVAYREEDRAGTERVLCQTMCCSNKTIAKQIAASQALHLLTPVYAKGIISENVPNRLVYWEPLDTRDNIFELNGHTLMEQAIELLSAAWGTTEGGRVGPEDVQRYMDTSVRCTDYANANRCLTAEFSELAHQKQAVGLGQKPVMFTWSLENLPGRDNTTDVAEYGKHFKHRFVLRQPPADDGAVNTFMTCESEYVGEPVTRVIYRGLLCAAVRLRCVSVIKDLFREFSLCGALPTGFNSLKECVSFFFDVFFGVRDAKPGSVFHLALEPRGNGMWECYMKLNLRECYYMDGRTSSGAESGLTKPLVNLMSRKNDTKTKICAAALVEAGAEAFSFVFRSIRHYLRQREASGREKQHENLRKALGHYEKMDAPDVNYSWTLDGEEEEVADTALVAPGNDAASATGGAAAELVRVQNFNEKDLLQVARLSCEARVTLLQCKRMWAPSFEIEWNGSEYGYGTVTGEVYPVLCASCFFERVYCVSIKAFRGGSSGEAVFEWAGEGWSLELALRRALLKSIIFMTSYRQMLRESDLFLEKDAKDNPLLGVKESSVVKMDGIGVEDGASPSGLLDDTDGSGAACWDAREDLEDWDFCNVKTYSEIIND